MNSTATLTWSDAVDAAMEPTDLDQAFNNSDSVFGPKRTIGADGKLLDWNLIRERAALAYLKAYQGRMVTVEYANPKFANERSRAIYRTEGVAQVVLVDVIEFSDDPTGYGNKVSRGFVINGSVVPFSGVSSIRTADDRSTVVL